MIIYLCLAILFIPVSKNISKSVDVNESRYQPGLYEVKEINKRLFFSFILFTEIDCKSPKNMGLRLLLNTAKKQVLFCLGEKKLIITIHFYYSFY